MKTLSKDKKIKYLILAFSFVIPCFAVLISYIIRGIEPFGGRTLCSMDGFSQYYPMLMNMDEALSKGEVFYSFHGALGFNLWAQSAYYTNSPLWLLVYMIPHEWQIEAIHFLIMLKIGLSGFFFSLRLLRKYENTDENKALKFFPALSTAWALSGYMIAFINQFMWTDVIMLLPLVVLGIEELVKNKKLTVYIVSLFLSIWSCFYLSFMVCIFSVLYFLFLILKEKMENKQRFSYCLCFGVGSLTAGAMAAVSLIPTAKALSLTLASEAGFNEAIEIKYTLGRLLMRLLPFQKISLEYGEPNLYCTLIAVVLMLFYFAFGKASKREKLLYFGFVTFMFLSMCTNIGEYLWHGFHFPNQLPARQSFLVIFLMLTIAAEGTQKLDFRKGAATFLSAVIISGASLSAVYQIISQVWAARVDSLQRYESSMEEFTALDDEDIFSRLAWTDEKKNNYPQQYNYNGICYYSSTMSGDAYEFFQNLGMERYAKNVSTRYNQSDILNAIFGIKYILEEDGETITVNENALPLAFLSDEAVLGVNLSDYKKGEEAQEALWDSVVLSKNDFDTQVSELKANGINLTYFDTDKIKGNITCYRDGVLLTSLPYDGGWRIFIDGEEAETTKAAGYLTCAEITEGRHEVEFRYTVPGIELGAALSLVGIICLVVIMNYELGIMNWIKKKM
ncbi:MAG: YfhO family protein [Clostridia bacterium]|nr:YfhO family protein [Clostridia bacterium]